MRVWFDIKYFKNHWITELNDEYHITPDGVLWSILPKAKIYLMDLSDEQLILLQHKIQNRILR